MSECCIVTLGRLRATMSRTLFTTALVLFAPIAVVACYPNVRLYEGSWKEYASLKDLPAERAEKTTTGR